MSSVLEDIDLGTIEVLENEPEIKDDQEEVHLYDFSSMPMSLCGNFEAAMNNHECSFEWFRGTTIPDSCPHCGRPICDICRTMHDIKGL